MEDIFTNQDIAGSKNYVMLGHNIASSLLDNPDNLGEVVKIGGEKVVVIGIFSKEGEDITGNSLDDAVVVPFSFGQTNYERKTK